MNWDFEFQPELGIVSVRTAGTLDYDALVEFIAAGADAMQRHQVTRILVDHRDAVLDISPTRVYRLPAVGVAHGLDRRQKVAVVISPSTAREEDVRAYVEVMARNALPHRLFRDPDAALDWLLGRNAAAPG